MATGTGVGNTVSFLVTFAATDIKQVSSIAVTTQSEKMNYAETEDGVLDLSGMVVTQTFNGGTQGTVTDVLGNTAKSDVTVLTVTTPPQTGARPIPLRSLLFSRLRPY